MTAELTPREELLRLAMWGDDRTAPGLLDAVEAAARAAGLTDYADRLERRAASLGAEWLRADQVVATARRIAADTLAAAGRGPVARPEENPVVAYRNPHRPGVLLCREHGDGWAGLIPLASEDLPDGGLCTYGRPSDTECGRDVLAPRPAPQPETAPDTLGAWLYQRFAPRGRSWDVLTDDDRTYWEHQARAVRRAVDRGGFKATAPDAAAVADAVAQLAAESGRPWGPAVALAATQAANDLRAAAPDPLAYGPTGYRCGCGKDAHSNLVPCALDPEPSTPETLPTGKDTRDAAQTPAGESTQPDTAGTYPLAMPWARQLDADDLEGLLADLADAAAGDDDLTTLAAVEDAIARWRAIGEATEAHRNAGPNGGAR